MIGQEEAQCVSSLHSVRLFALLAMSAASYAPIAEEGLRQRASLYSWLSAHEESLNRSINV
jgi:hypothetical protein